MMFLVDDLISKVLDYFKDTLISNRKASEEAISHARKAMRQLPASHSEMAEYL